MLQEFKLRKEQEEDEGEIATVLPDSMFIQKIYIPLQDRILSAMEEDHFGRQAIISITQAGLPPLKSMITDWKVEEGLLFYKNRLYVPANLGLRREILELHHDLPVMGHPGIFKTLVLVKRNFWWPGLYTFALKYVQGCAMCQQMKTNTHPTTLPLNLISVDKDTLPFSTVTMDFITDLPISQGFDSLMVVVDHDLSKGIILIPCTKSIDALGTAKAYHQHVYRRFGLPK